MARTQQSKSLTKTLIADSVFLDTHIVCWLYAGELSLLSPAATDAIESHALVISPMVELELQYLYEISRISLPASDIITALQTDIGLRVVDDGLSSVIQHSKSIHWTRDPFDRMIVAHAMLRKIQLISRDNLIQIHFQPTIW